jgi:hypothetical protein
MPSSGPTAFAEKFADCQTIRVVGYNCGLVNPTNNPGAYPQLVYSNYGSINGNYDSTSGPRFDQSYGILAEFQFQGSTMSGPGGTRMPYWKSSAADLWLIYDSNCGGSTDTTVPPSRTGWLVTSNQPSEIAGVNIAPGGSTTPGDLNDGGCNNVVMKRDSVAGFSFTPEGPATRMYQFCGQYLPDASCGTSTAFNQLNPGCAGFPPGGDNSFFGTSTYNTVNFRDIAYVCDDAPAPAPAPAP